MIKVDRAAFFTSIRKVFGRFNQYQVNGFTTILDGLEADPRVHDPRHAAYMLATTWHETAGTMQPIAEYGKGRGRRYGVPGRNNRQIPYGRGYVQLTWDTNYERADRELELDGALIANYELALDPAIAYQIFSIGMVEGWFTGKRLRDYITASRTDYINARRIINGTDRAAKIAGYARSFQSALQG